MAAREGVVQEVRDQQAVASALLLSARVKCGWVYLLPVWAH